MSLPEPWIDEIFSRLAVRYGVAFQRQYADLDPTAVRADWAHVLGILESHPKAIKYALDNLPADRPPNAVQFKALAMPMLSEARQEVPALPAPKADPAQIEAALSALRGFTEPPSLSAADQCIENLRQRQSNGMRLTPAQREMLAACSSAYAGRGVLEVMGDFKPVPPELLPPGMRAGREVQQESAS